MAEKTTKSYSELKQQLDDILYKLQHPELDVDEAVLLHKQGQKIITELDKYLKLVSKEVTKK